MLTVLEFCRETKSICHTETHTVDSPQKMAHMIIEAKTSNGLPSASKSTRKYGSQGLGISEARNANGETLSGADGLIAEWPPGLAPRVQRPKNQKC